MVGNRVDGAEVVTRPLFDRTGRTRNSLIEVESGYQVSVIRGDDRGRTISLDYREIHLGRKSGGSSRSNWVYFADPTVSRHHATLVWDDELRHFTLHHRSLTNPTLVNGKRVLQCPLADEDVIQIGFLICRMEYVGTREAVEAARRNGTQIAPPPNPRQPEVDDSVDQSYVQTGLQFVVSAGPDLGAVYPLTRTVLFIGRRADPDDPRGANGILLRDDGIPKEQALLAWNEHERTYSIFQLESAVLPTRVLRAAHGAVQSIVLDQNMQMILQPGDVLRMGETALRFEREDVGLPEEKLDRVADEGQGERSVSSHGRGGDELLETRALTPSRARRSLVSRSSSPTEPQTMWPGSLPEDQHKGDDEKSQAAPATPEPPYPSITLEPVPFPTIDKFVRNLPTHVGDGPADAPETDGPSEFVVDRTPRQSSGSTTPVLSGEADGVEGFDFRDGAFAWRYNADYVIGFLEGRNRGEKVALLRRDLEDDRRITIGTGGERSNDIEIEDPSVVNRQATVTYRDGRFRMVNEGKDGSISLDQTAMGNGEERLLKTGDRIGMGKSLLIFLERAVVQVLTRFELCVVAGVPEDCKRSFGLLRESVVVGRTRSCDITLTDPEVSRRHLAISLRNGRFYLTHISARHTTFVNGVALTRARDRIINDGDTIQVSDQTTLLFRERQE